MKLTWPLFLAILLFVAFVFYEHRIDMKRSTEDQIELLKRDIQELKSKPPVTILAERWSENEFTIKIVDMRPVKSGVTK